MVLKPQDLLVALLLAVRSKERWSFPAIARATGLSLSEAHGALRRAARARLVGPDPSGSGVVVPLRENLLEFLVHGARYAFPPERGGVTRGVPTAHSAPVLAKKFARTGEAPWVWPSAEGKVRGESFSPLYRSAPQAALGDSKLYDALALVDAVRGGAARERELGAAMLTGLIMDPER